MAWRSFGDEELRNLADVIESQELWRGPQGNFVARFEDAFANHLGRRYVHAVASGTAANEAALVGVGVGPGDEVICPPCSFIASSMAAVGLGAVPVFADVDPRTLILRAETLEAAITPRAKAVVVVHLWGQPAEMPAILDVAKRHGLAVVEDCAQAYDARCHGQLVGTFGDVACFSLQQSKHITSGEGGIVATDDPAVYERAVLYANCGMPWYRYDLEAPRSEPVGDLLTRGHFAFGHNYRMSELQGAVALAQLAKIGAFNEQRRRIVAALEAELRDVAGVALAHRYPETEPNYWCYPLRVESMTTGELDQLCHKRQGAGIPRYAEVNYLEAVYQVMDAQRATSVGMPLPEYVRYEPGLCPQAEEGAQHLIPVSTHHSVDPASVAELGRTIRAALTSA